MSQKKLVKKLERDDQMIMVLRSLFLLIQNLCEGNNKKIKEFLRAQHSSTADIDIVSEIARFMERFVGKFLRQVKYISPEEYPSLCSAIGVTYVSNKERNKSFIDFFSSDGFPTKAELVLAIQTLRTMTEMIQGPILANQILLANSKMTQNLISLLEFIGIFQWHAKLNADHQGYWFAGDNKEDIFCVVAFDTKDKSVLMEIPTIQKYIYRPDLEGKPISKIEVPKSLRSSSKDIFFRNRTKAHQGVWKKKRE